MSQNLSRDDIDFLRHRAKVWGNSMRVRLEHGARKFGARSFLRGYSDADNVDRLYRAVDHLERALNAVRREEARPDGGDAYLALLAELPKRAADVANQAFMLADYERVSGADREAEGGQHG